MKILEITPSLGTGGGEKFTIDLSNALADTGHNCAIVTLYDPSDDDVLRSYVQNNVVTYSLGKRSGADIRCMFRVVRCINKHKPDVVHAHLSAIMYLFLAVLVCRRVKFFATIHSEARREAGSGLSKWIRKFLFKSRLVKPVTISEESEKSFEDFYGFATVMIPNGCSEYTPNEEVKQKFMQYREGVDMLFIHAGRIHRVKNQIMLVEAFESLLQKGINARLLIAGRVEDNLLFEQLRSHFSDRVVYVGEQSDIRSIMSVADAFCLSSTIEGMPITIIEAFSVGCVPIVTPVGGCINMIEDGVNGYISSGVDTQRYLDALLQFALSDRTAKCSIKENCINVFKTRYSIGQTAEHYLCSFMEQTLNRS